MVVWYGVYGIWQPKCNSGSVAASFVRKQDLGGAGGAASSFPLACRGGLYAFHALQPLPYGSQEGVSTVFSATSCLGFCGGERKKA